MAVAELIVSRREVLGAACAGALPLARHPGLDPGSPFSSPDQQEGSGIPDRVRNDEEGRAERWRAALGRFRGAEAAIAAAEGAADILFDRVNARFNRALLRLFRAPAPNVAGLAVKLDLLVEHQAWELTFAPSALAALRRDARRLARSAPTWA